MNRNDLIQLRLLNQGIAQPDALTPESVVSRLGAVQAQDFSGSKWSVGLRMVAGAEADLDQAFATGAILRTHILRPTWHFVLPNDIRWMLALTAPRVRAINARMLPRQNLDSATLKRANDLIGQALQGGQQLTRSELGSRLAQAGIPSPQGLRLGLMMMHAELDGIICSGARRGRQFTYALLDERAPQAPLLARDEALIELISRFFASRGPATAQDFAKWSGLTMADARRGLDAVTPHLQKVEMDGSVYWGPIRASIPRSDVPAVHLLSAFDEFFSSYQTRFMSRNAELNAMGADLGYLILVDGHIAGIWKRSLSKNQVTLKAHLFTALSEAAREAFAQAVQRYGRFLGLTATAARMDP